MSLSPDSESVVNGMFFPTVSFYPFQVEMAATPPSVEDTLRLTRQAIEQVLRTHSVKLRGKEYNTVDMDSVYAAVERAVRSAGVASFVRFEHERYVSDAALVTVRTVYSAAARDAVASFSARDNRREIAGLMASLVGQVFLATVIRRPYTLDRLIEEYIRGMRESGFTLTPLAPTAGAGGARAATASTASTAANPSPEDVDRALKKSTFRIREVLNTVRPAAPTANNAMIERMRIICRRYYPTGILPYLEEFRSTRSVEEQMNLAHSIQSTIFSEAGEHLGYDNTSAEARIRCFTLFLMMRALIGYKDGKEIDATVIRLVELAREKGTSDAFFAVRDSGTATAAATAGAATEGGRDPANAVAPPGGVRANAVAPAAFEDPSCVVCEKPSKYRCARCAGSSGPEGRYCSEECQRIDWARGHGQYHAEKHAAAEAAAEAEAVAAAKAEAAANNNGNPKRPSAATQRLTAARNENKDPALPVSKNEPKPPSERKSRKARRTRKHRS